MGNIYSVRVALTDPMVRSRLGENTQKLDGHRNDARSPGLLFDPTYYSMYRPVAIEPQRVVIASRWIGLKNLPNFDQDIDDLFFGGNFPLDRRSEFAFDFLYHLATNDIGNYDLFTPEPHHVQSVI